MKLPIMKLGSPKRIHPQSELIGAKNNEVSQAIQDQVSPAASTPLHGLGATLK